MFLDSINYKIYKLIKNWHLLSTIRVLEEEVLNVEAWSLLFEIIYVHIILGLSSEVDMLTQKKSSFICNRSWILTIWSSLFPRSIQGVQTSEFQSLRTCRGSTLHVLYIKILIWHPELYVITFYLELSFIYQ